MAARQLGIGSGIVLVGMLFAALAPAVTATGPQSPYAWLRPRQGQHGGATGASAMVPTSNGRNLATGLFTREEPDQAEVITPAGALILSPATTSIKLSIEPVWPTAFPVDVWFESNVYRVQLTDQLGEPVTALPNPTADSRTGAVVLLRAADPVLDQSNQWWIDENVGAGWQPIASSRYLGDNFYTAAFDGSGDYLLVAPTLGMTPPSPAVSAQPTTTGSSPSVVATAGLAASATPGLNVPAQPAGGSPIALIVLGVLVGAALAGLVVVRTTRRGAG